MCHLNNISAQVNCCEITVNENERRPLPPASPIQGTGHDEGLCRNCQSGVAVGLAFGDISIT